EDVIGLAHGLRSMGVESGVGRGVACRRRSDVLAGPGATQRHTPAPPSSQVNAANVMAASSSRSFMAGILSAVAP
ncbi:hypothetical protein ABTK94_19300, partial [Acinetobacter baumannii]